MSTHAAASVDCVQAADREAGRLWWSNLASLSMTPARRPPPREELVGRYPTPRLQLLLTIANLVAGRVWCRHILQSQRRRRWGWGQVEKVKLATQKGWRLSSVDRQKVETPGAFPAPESQRRGVSAHTCPCQQPCFLPATRCCAARERECEW